MQGPIALHQVAGGRLCVLPYPISFEMLPWCSKTKGLFLGFVFVVSLQRERARVDKTPDACYGRVAPCFFLLRGVT